MTSPRRKRKGRPWPKRTTGSNATAKAFRIRKPCGGWDWSEGSRMDRASAVKDMAALDRGIASRVKQAVERFAETGAGNVKRLQGIDPPAYRLRVGDYRVRFHQYE